MAKTCELSAEASLSTATPLLPFVSTPPQPSSSSKPNQRLEIRGYPVEGVSIGGKETCVIFPTLSVTFDIGVGLCLERAFSQEFLFMSHGHLDHIGGLPMYVSARGFLGKCPPTIFIPACLRDLVEQLFEVHRAITQSELKHNLALLKLNCHGRKPKLYYYVNVYVYVMVRGPLGFGAWSARPFCPPPDPALLVALEVGEEYQLRTNLKVTAFRTYHVIPSQGYVICSVKQKLKQEFIGLPVSEIKRLRLSGVELTNTLSTPEIAFTGDTTSDFILDPDNADVLAAKVLVVESTFLDDSMSIEHAKKYGHTHICEIAGQCDKLRNKAILLTHFSPRYTLEDIDAATDRLPLSLRSRVYALKEGFLSKDGSRNQQ